MSSYITGIDEETDNATRSAIHEKRGMFILPQELFCCPFNLWQLHQGLRENPDMYKEFHPIINTPADTTATWKPKQRVFGRKHHTKTLDMA
jgi:hypothetical protein